jgi:hypothetical protein
MLAILHDKIMKVIPINGVSQDYDKNITVSYIDQPDDYQLNKINHLINSWPLELKKIEKISQIEFEWKKIIEQGWNCGQGHLGLSASDVALLSGAFTLAKEAAALGYPIPPLVTLEDNLINFSSIQEMTALLLQYGAARSAMSVNFAERRKVIENATTLKELEAI